MSTPSCRDCSTALADSVLSCPQCGWLIHSERLEELAKRARASWRIGDFAAERTLWCETAALLPEGTVQHRTVSARIAELDEQIKPLPGKASPGRDRAATLGIGSALLILISKWKILLLGFTKLGTAFSMIAALGVYWSLFGWPFALGLVLSIYIHEMGHVIAIRGYGLHASAPMFIPGLGAFIRMHTRNLPPIPDARIGLAGPMYGAGAAIAAWILFKATGLPIFVAIAHLGVVINLFNLIPVWQLDGSRGMHSLTRHQRTMIMVLAAVLWWLTHESMFLLIAGVSVYRLFTERLAGRTG
jgi:Zn-dependent protease